MNLPASLPSPLLGSKAVARLIGKKSARRIVDGYLKQFNYDASHNFDEIDEVGIYECEASGYQFYYPFSLAGDETLYRQLNTLEWDDDKWEHNVVLSHVASGDRVLDVGCGRGFFLSKAAASRGAIVTGIELNKAAAEVVRDRGVEVVSELISDHASVRPLYYDVVTSFQVLEHIADPLPFVKNCLDVLKPNGLLVFGVPNNDAFLKFDPDMLLNGPPHHMGLWTRRSLSALADLLPIRVSGFEVEPLAEKDWYQQVMERRYLPSRWHRSVFYRLGGSRRFRQFIDENASSIAGPAIVAFYRKAP